MANLLDAFSIGFNSQGLKDFEEDLKRNEKELDKYEKEVKVLEDSLKEMAEAHGEESDAFKATTKKLQEAREKVKNYSKAVEDLKGSPQASVLQLTKSFGKLVKTMGLLAVVGTAIKKSVDFYEQGEQLDFLSQKANIAVESLQALGGASGFYGGTTEGTASSVENVRQRGGALGISTKGSPEQVLENVARKMETLKTTADKLKLADSLGIDEGTTRLLIQGVSKYREELQRANKYRLYTKEDIQRIRDYRQIQNDIRMGTQAIGGAIYRMLLPAITTVSKVIRAITDWLAEHEGAVKIIATLVGVTAAIGALVLGVNLLSGALTFLAANPVVLMIIGIGLAITALIAIVQDFVTFLQGGDSIIGELLAKWGVDVDAFRENCLNAFENIKNFFLNMVEGLKNAWEGFKSLFGGKTSLNAVNNNKLNSVPGGAVSNSYQTQSLTNNKSSNKNVNIGNITVNTQAKDAQSVARAVGEIADMDNGTRT